MFVQQKHVFIFSALYFNFCMFLHYVLYSILSFSRIINKHTDESLGDCSFLNTCFHMDTCKYVHYEIDSPPEAEGSLLGPQAGTTELGLRAGDVDSNVGKLFPSQVRKGGDEGGEREARTLTEGLVFFLCSGSAVISATWTCPSWGSLLWWWLTLRGTSTWSCPTARWLTTRWENSTSPSCKMTASSSSGWLAGN